MGIKRVLIFRDLQLEAGIDDLKQTLADIGKEVKFFINRTKGLRVLVMILLRLLGTRMSPWLPLQSSVREINILI